MNPGTIKPEFRTKPTRSLKFLTVGRKVGQEEIENYFIDYFREKGWCEKLQYDKNKGWWYAHNFRFRLI